MSRFVVLITAVFAWISLACATPPADLGARIDGFVNTFLANPACKTATTGIVIQSLDDGTVWYTRSGESAFIPASTAKLVTASMALTYLPVDYRFTTRCYATGPITNGVLHGDLVVQGGGDPSLTTDDLTALATQLAVGDTAACIPPLTAITGTIRFDDTAFTRSGPQLGKGWEKSDLPWYYAAPASALSLNRNALLITVQGTTDGQPATVTVTPPTRLFTVTNTAVTSAQVTTGTAEVLPDGWHIAVRGTLAPGAVVTEKVSVSDPPRFLVEQFARALAAAGITLGSETTNRCSNISPEWTCVAAHDSAPLDAILHTLMKESDNHTAEQLRWTLLTQGIVRGKLKDRDAQLQHDFTARMGIENGRIALVDGSGLSRLNRMTPVATVHLLAAMAASPYFDHLYHNLPIAGVDGTLKTRMINTPAQGAVHAKTGTMRGVCTLAGYVTTADGERLALAVFVNGYTSGATDARTLQDNIAAYLAGL